jgi:hypothetical protein
MSADALGLFRGRVDRGDLASILVVRGFSLVHDPEGSHYRVSLVRHTLN